MGRLENDASNNSSIVTCTRCRSNVFTESLPSNHRRIHIQTHRLKEEMYEVSSGSMMYIPSSIKIVSGIQTLIGGIHVDIYKQTHTHTHSKVIS
jgi:hypothetical protein